MCFVNALFTALHDSRACLFHLLYAIGNVKREGQQEEFGKTVYYPVCIMKSLVDLGG